MYECIRATSNLESYIFESASNSTRFHCIASRNLCTLETVLVTYNSHVRMRQQSNNVRGHFGVYRYMAMHCIWNTLLINDMRKCKWELCLFLAFPCSSHLIFSPLFLSTSLLCVCVVLHMPFWLPAFAFGYGSNGNGRGQWITAWRKENNAMLLQYVYPVGCSSCIRNCQLKWHERCMFACAPVVHLTTRIIME